MRRIGSGFLVAALMSWVAAIVGCGHQPAAPEVPISNSVTVASAPSGEDPVLLGLLNPVKLLPTVLGSGLQLLQPITGSTGGTVQVGDVTVKFPPNAVQGDVQVKVTVPDTTKLECYLNIYPESKNHFDVPVSLQFELPRDADPRIMTVFWFDEAARAWVSIPASYDATSGKLSASLQHFSIYKADKEVQGRAGW